MSMMGKRMEGEGGGWRAPRSLTHLSSSQGRSNESPPTGPGFMLWSNQERSDMRTRTYLSTIDPGHPGP